MISYLRGNILDAVINIACIALPNAVMSGAKALGKTCKSAGEFVSKLSKEARGMVKTIASFITGIRDAIGKIIWLVGEKIIRPIMDKLDKFADKVKSIFSEATEKEAKDKAAKEAVSKGADADFYVAPNGKVLPGKYKDWIGTNMRDSVMNSVDDVKLKNAIGEVYRPGSVIGDGGTADVIRFERETGILLSKSGHVQKGVDMSKYFQKLLDSGTLSAKDAKVASKILEDLKKALGGK